jgi:hypothetical protein
MSNHGVISSSHPSDADLPASQMIEFQGRTMKAPKKQSVGRLFATAGGTSDVPGSTSSEASVAKLDRTKEA